MFGRAVKIIGAMIIFKDYVAEAALVNYAVHQL